MANLPPAAPGGGIPPLYVGRDGRDIRADLFTMQEMGLPGNEPIRMVPFRGHALYSHKSTQSLLRDHHDRYGSDLQQPHGDVHLPLVAGIYPPSVGIVPLSLSRGFGTLSPGRQASYPILTQWGQPAFSTLNDAILDPLFPTGTIKGAPGAWAKREWNEVVMANRKLGICSGGAAQDFIMAQFPLMMPQPNRWSVVHMGQNGGSAMEFALTTRGNSISTVLVGALHYLANEGWCTNISTSGFGTTQFKLFWPEHLEAMRKHGGHLENSVISLPYAPIGCTALWTGSTLPIVYRRKTAYTGELLTTALPSLTEETFARWEQAFLSWLRQVVLHRQHTTFQVTHLVVEVVLSCGPFALRPSFLQSLHGLCDEYGILLVIDEILTRHKVSDLFASTHPDYRMANGDSPGHLIVCGKAEMGLVLVRKDVNIQPRAKHTDDMYINGQVHPFRQTPEMANGQADLMLREITEAKCRNYLQGDRLPWRQANFSSAVQFADEVLRCIPSAEVTGMGCLLYLNHFITLDEGCRQDVRDAFGILQDRPAPQQGAPLATVKDEYGFAEPQMQKNHVLPSKLCSHIDLHCIKYCQQQSTIR